MASAAGRARFAVPLNVIPEPIDDTWWTWMTTAAASWKRSYRVTGTFANQALVGMTLTALTALEHPTDVAGTGQDATVAASVPALPVLVMAGGSAPATFVSVQNWTWLAKGTFVEVGPRSRRFSYVATFSVTDVFGNVYPPIPSTPTLVTVAVPFLKLSNYATGRALVVAGLVFLAAAIVAAAIGGPYGWAVAVGAAAGGMGMIIGGLFLLSASAYDPPIPIFGTVGLSCRTRVRGVFPRSTMRTCTRCEPSPCSSPASLPRASGHGA